MSGIARMRDAGAFVKHVVGVAAQAAGAGDIDGAAIDRIGFQSAVLVVNAGAADVADDAVIDAKIQHRTDSNDTFTDFGDPITQITADNVLEEVDIDLEGAKAEVRVVVTVAFDSTGTEVPVSAELMLGGAVEAPA